MCIWESIWPNIWANISKFQSIILKPRSVIADVEFHVSGYSLKPLPCVKLLRVQIDKRMSFDEHVSSIYNCVSQQINAFHRISEYLMLENRLYIYNAFLTSNFSYCNTVWHFCRNQSMYKLEKGSQAGYSICTKWSHMRSIGQSVKVHTLCIQTKIYCYWIL